MKILIVDDDPSILAFMVRALSAKGHSVYSCNSGAKGIAILKKETFELMITDIVMPDEDGLGIIQYIQSAAMDPKPKIIAISGGSEHLNKEIFLHCASTFGALRTIPKPFDVETLFKTIDELISLPAPSGNSFF